MTIVDDEASQETVARDRRKKEFILSFPRQLKPEDLLDFIELKAFSKHWNQLGLNAEEDLSALQVSIMVNPKHWPVISGTNGLRKLRFSPDGWGKGKSGGVRVLYVHFEEFGFVLLCFVYAKNELENISDAAKQKLNELIQAAEKELSRRFEEGKSL